MSNWISVKDRLPKAPKGWHVYVIALDANKKVFPIQYASTTVRGKPVERFEYVWDRIYDGVGITHWMPLPEPPEEGGAE